MVDLQVSKQWDLNTFLEKYSYLADGTKISAMDSTGTSYRYYGPMVYTVGADGDKSFMSVTSSSPETRYRFTGKEDQSPAFGISYTDFGARHYSPNLRRWLVPDPLSEQYYDVSPYAYCAGEPVNLVDEVGMKHQEEGVMSLSQDSHRNANVTQENIEQMMNSNLDKSTVNSQ